MESLPSGSWGDNFFVPWGGDLKFSPTSGGGLTKWGV